MKENKYDDTAFFLKYNGMDRSVAGLQGAGEWHILKRMLPSFEGKRVLDLGCGFGWHCAYAAVNGASEVLGLDISEKMIEGAQERNSSPAVKYERMAIEDYAYPSNAFDVVISSLAFHYLASFDDIAFKVFRTLSPGGQFVFSAEHPVFTARGDQQWVENECGEKLFWPVDRYFSEGRREADFLGEKVVKYHRTLTNYINSLLKAGFVINGFSEPYPSEEMLEAVPGMEDELRRPMMLIISAVKQ